MIGFCVEINESLENLLGRHRDELVGHFLTDIDFIDNIQGKMLQGGLAETATNHFTLPFALKDGLLKYGSFHVTRTTISGQDHLIISLMALSDRPAVSVHDNGFEEMYRKACEESHDAILLMEIDVACEANPAALALFGYTRKEDFFSKRLPDLSPDRQPDGSDSTSKSMMHIENARRGIGTLFEWVFQKADGTPFFAEVRLSRIVLQDKVYLQACFRDISHRKREEAALHQSGELFQILAENAPLALLLVDAEQNFTYISPWYTKMFGYNKADTPNCKAAIDAFYPDSDYRKKINDVWNVARQQKPGSIQSIRATTMRCKDGSEKKLQIISTALADSSCLLLFLDITDLIETEQLYERSRKLESVSTLAGGIAHDFNNLLATVLGYIELAKMDTKIEESTLKHLMAAEWALQQSTELTHRLITFAKGGQPFKRIFNPADVISQEWDRLEDHRILKRELSVSHDLWCIDADEGQIKQVIKSLFANAIEAMDGKGTLRVRLDNTLVTPADRLPVKAGPYVVLSVQDTGRGIAPKDLPLIFDPYFSTKALGSQRGTGLGLSVAYSIVNKHDGHITVESTRGKGSRFCVYLPAILQNVSEIKTEEIGAGDKGQVLVMDDDPLFAEMMRDMVTTLGYEVTVVNDGFKAIDAYMEALKQRPEPFRLVILDLMVKDGLGGKMTMEKLLEIDPQVKAIICSGYMGDHTLRDYHQHGFIGALKKPFNISQLEALLRQTDSAAS